MALWIKAHDKIAQGEMPPKKRPRPPQAELDQVTHWLYQQLHAHSREKQEKEGRVVLRRLNGTEYENTVRDLLSVNLSVKALLPEDNAAAGFEAGSAVVDDKVAALVEERLAAWWLKPNEGRLDLIGWAADVRTARKLAADSNRPLFLFTMDGRVNTGRC